MTWWLWVLFWLVFWTLTGAYLTWRTWKLWPHARDFGRTVQEAWERVETARQSASDLGESARRAHSTELTTMTDVDSLAWNKPAASWRAEWRTARNRRRELQLDKHASTWAAWRRRVD